MSYFYGRIAGYENLFEMDQDGVVRPCDGSKQAYVDNRIAAGYDVIVLSSCKTGLHPLYDCEGKKHFVLHKTHDRTFFHNISDDTVWCLPRNKKRFLHFTEEECPLTAFLQLAVKRDDSITLWNKSSEEYEEVKKVEHGWAAFAQNAVFDDRMDEMWVPGIDCSHYALTKPRVNGAS